jgi:hypothetical protein
VTPPPERAAARLRGPAAVVLIALAASLALAGCQISSPSAEPTSATSSAGSTVNTTEFSTLDASGVAEIRNSKSARLDMTSGRLEKETVRVTQDSYGPEINTRDSGKISLTIAGPSGDVTGETDRIRFNTTTKRQDFSEVTYFLTTGSPDEFFDLIRDGVERYGIDSDSAERWISSRKANPEGKSDYSLAPGTSTGLAVSYDLRYDGAKDTQVIIVHVSPTA